MSLPEYIPSDLPQYAPLTDRADLNNAVIESGHALIFAESDGSSGTQLAAKLPDGTFQTLGGTGGGSLSIYKCASVDATAQTWTGYAYESGSVSETVTTGLSYTSPVTPTVGKYYTQDGLIECNVHAQTGLVFYAPFESNSAAETNQAIYSVVGDDVTFQRINGVPCAFFNGSKRIGYNFSKISGQADFSMGSFLWLSSSPSDYSGFLYLGDFSWNTGLSRVFIAVSDGTLVISLGAIDSSKTAISNNLWHHVLMTYSGSSNIYSMYVDGSIAVTWSPPSGSCNTTPEVVWVGGSIAGQMINAYMAQVKIWDRVLSASEIASEYQRLRSMTTT